jgi:hypothetical protein
MAFFMSSCSVHVMVKDESELLSIRPPFPPLRCVGGLIVYGPDIRIARSLQTNNLASDLDLEPTWDEGLKLVIDFVEYHERVSSVECWVLSVESCELAGYLGYLS